MASVLNVIIIIISYNNAPDWIRLFEYLEIFCDICYIER